MGTLVKNSVDSGYDLDRIAKRVAEIYGMEPRRRIGDVHWIIGLWFIFLCDKGWICHAKPE